MLKAVLFLNSDGGIWVLIDSSGSWFGVGKPIWKTYWARSMADAVSKILLHRLEYISSFFSCAACAAHGQTPLRHENHGEFQIQSSIKCWGKRGISWNICQMQLN